jgi:hypothetical protein
MEVSEKGCGIWQGLLWSGQGQWAQRALTRQQQDTHEDIHF